MQSYNMHVSQSIFFLTYTTHRRCGYQWCWLCGSKFKEDHFDRWNVFGCTGLQFVEGWTKCRLFWFALLQFLLIPLILIMKPIRVIFASFRNPLYFPQGWRWCCPYQGWLTNCCLYRCCCCRLALCLTIYTFILPMLILFGFVVGLLNCAIMILPAWAYQLYRITRIVFNRCACCFK